MPVTQDDSILAMKATKHGPMPQPPTAGLSSSNPDLVQCHHSVPGSSPGNKPRLATILLCLQTSFWDVFSSSVMVMVLYLFIYLFFWVFFYLYATLKITFECLMRPFPHVVCVGGFLVTHFYNYAHF